ncbi:NAD(P)H-quinone oxidoreductase subunit F [Aphanizomenon flos-aquae NRERC-008]|jgi:NAD(P)H-quinone oxidoreductase subunit 5|uniref:NAD(P)H-quinone oxidoreductase subunit F n=1 Tax=Aphanizomenon flos-aquae FACHB-1249 TaxID=2692889 RepID=A0ABR8IS78_APHFL|nr:MULTISPECIES: NAD(P)H-quinone oxidoreductase subunit F [Aphanizomenon]MCE2903584.1 NAD(P)H-quinone oxidoreductase subunit F [Anabaena sp. CoA2_C59]MDJ0507194.1 NAD(P)H-quinone oxidoreductase subunit F [Nostocales cyanobacterium LE14-WE12]MBD2389202.1 NAD(P)H-quinone oxidoreductase subunit F [Aphanizomenon flos-aquae FACHB-1171]MBD2555423.1 NAD(P)H-quinone oxidoreductase subunit F [Aphanizomenon flos-aquae FACHB-1290]MBD2631598.1 NAD(P)H-quinone oxidoreductase subunit F [Aphanizomenon sp. FA
MDQYLLDTIWLIPVYALIGGLLAIPWSPGIIRKTGPRPAGYVNVVMTFFSFFHAVLAFFAIWNHPAKEVFIPWLSTAGLNLTINLEISAVSVGALIVITGLNLLAQIYAIGYMEMDWGWGRFFSLLGLFEAGLCGLVLCNDLFSTYVILEVLTLGTYLLVGLWFSQPLVVTGARDAFLTKRVGDLFLLMGVLGLWTLSGTWNYSELATWAATANVDPTIITLVCLGLIAGPMGKCAQFPLHLWLDEAMEGPVPSTILRSSVVVASGAWVLIKLQPVFSLSPVAASVMVAIGTVTAIGGALIAIAQIDIKRCLSYSVSVYMGLVFIAVGTQQNEAALLLVLTHAVSAALLVMSTGGIVWNSVTQDVTQLGGLWSRRPISGLAFIVGTLGLIGFPPLGSFWALFKLADGLWATHPTLVGIIIIVNGLTTFSLTREFSLIFGGKPKQMSERSPEAIWLMVLPMVILSGFVLHLPLVLQSLSLLPDWATLNKDVALLLIWSSIFGCSISSIIYLGNIPKPIRLPWQGLQNLFAYDFYTPKLYKITIIFGVAQLSKFADMLDKFVIDGIVNSVGLFSLLGGEGLKYSNNGQTQFYALTVLLGVGVLGTWLTWPFWGVHLMKFIF